MVAVLSADAIRAMRNPAALAPLTDSLRTMLRDALSAENIAAARMTDTEFWSYDQAWLGLGTAPTKRDTQRPGGCGGGGCNMSWDNNQYWELGMPCDRGVFAFVLFQQRRYMAAQIRIRRHLAAAPQPAVVEGFDRMASTPTLSVREACQGQAPRDAAADWAHWAEEALRLIGAARWATNTTWSEGTQGIADMAPPTARLLPLTGGEHGCSYRPDCSADPFGTARLGYVSGLSPRGMRRFETLMGRRYAGSSGEKSTYYEAGLNYAGAAPLPGRTGIVKDAQEVQGAARMWEAPAGTMPGEQPPFCVAPSALALHRSSRTLSTLELLIPQDAQAFNARLWPETSVPSFLGQPGDKSLGSWLYAFFLEQPSNPAIYAAQLPFREMSGSWWGRRSNQRLDAMHRWAFPSAASEIHIWRIVAMLRDIADRSYGEVMVDSFTALDRTIETLPAWAKSVPLAQAQAAMKELFKLGQSRTAEMVGGTLAGVAAVAAAINPIAGLIVSLLGALATALVTFAGDIGLVRTQNPIALQAFAMRMVPAVPGGDDRCAINPGTETIDAYRTRVASPYAEAARRTGGEAGAMFEEINRVRNEQYCLANPQVPQCMAPPPPPSSTASWEKWGALVASGAVGFVAVKIVGG